MQEVDLTPSLLKDFSKCYARVPNVIIQGGEGVPFDVLILAAWFQELHEGAENSRYFGLFQAWLAGTDRFVMPDLSQKEFMKLLAEIVQTQLEKGGRYGS